MNDRILGGSMLLGAGAFFVYYTLWTIILPFFDPSSPVHGWFPPREWANRIVASILITGISSIGLFVGAKIVFSG